MAVVIGAQAQPSPPRAQCSAFCRAAFQPLAVGDVEQTRTVCAARGFRLGGACALSVAGHADITRGRVAISGNRTPTPSEPANAAA
ncbi:hypothetical protein [Nocardia rhizosphaerihabitans]|uniref:hypothetical protein n=1 Tax=Nocardia rhizosphaerihabitans TaxID=1691570 RepID=UPI00166D63BD|nr:hypothetical protein [Nocardia rhizosphaerihabitans]